MEAIMIQHEVCESCKGCCRYDDYCTNEFSEEELQHHFCFSRHMSQTFFSFDKQKNKFIMKKYCQHYDNFHCDIYNTDEFPFVCATYPFFIIIKKSFLKHESTLHLAIDRNCPHWKLFLEQADKVDQIIKKYLEKDLPIDFFPQKKMHSLGYRLTLLDTQLPSIS